jgi:hypothetical protein
MLSALHRGVCRAFTNWAYLKMWIVAIAWMYVAVMMALAEATSPQGSVLGALITLVFYGLAPMALVMYLLGTPTRRKARLAAQATELAELERQKAMAAEVSIDASGPASAQADAGSLPPGDAVASVGKEP